MKFNSRKDWYFKTLNIAFLSIWVIFICFGINYSEFQLSDYLSLLPILIIACTVALKYKLTKYELTENLLICKSLFQKEIIPIDRIHNITPSNKFFIGSNPATAKSGLLIKHQTYREIYISPEDQDIFIERLLEMNGNIYIKCQLKEA